MIEFPGLLIPLLLLLLIISVTAHAILKSRFNKSGTKSILADLSSVKSNQISVGADSFERIIVDQLSIAFGAEPSEIVGANCLSDVGIPIDSALDDDFDATQFEAQLSRLLGTRIWWDYNWKSLADVVEGVRRQAPGQSNVH